MVSSSSGSAERTATTMATRREFLAMTSVLTVSLVPLVGCGTTGTPNGNEESPGDITGDLCVVSPISQLKTSIGPRGSVILADVALTGQTREDGGAIFSEVAFSEATVIVGAAAFDSHGWVIGGAHQGRGPHRLGVNGVLWGPKGRAVVFLNPDLPPPTGWGQPPWMVPVNDDSAIISPAGCWHEPLLHDRPFTRYRGPDPQEVPGTRTLEQAKVGSERGRGLEAYPLQDLLDKIRQASK